MISGEDFERTIKNFDNNFSLHLLDLLEKLSHYSTTDCEHQMLNIIARLDHNGYYTAQLEKKAAQGETNSSPSITLLSRGHYFSLFSFNESLAIRRTKECLQATVPSPLTETETH